MELKAEEIRISNYVFCDGHIGQVLEIAQDRITFKKLYPDADALNIAIKHVTGIELTPELLEKCGFDHRHLGGQSMMIDDKPYGRKSITIARNTDNSKGHWTLCVTDFTYESNIGTDTIILNRELKYLHQLQNAMILLTASELEVKI